MSITPRILSCSEKAGGTIGNPGSDIVVCPVFHGGMGGGCGIPFGKAAGPV